MIKQILDLDRSFEQYIYLHRYNGADNFLRWATEHATYISFSLLILLVIVFLFNKKQIYLYAAANALIVNGITALITALLKISVARLRPYEINKLITTPLIDSGGYSFPSGHTTEVFALFFTVFFILRKSYFSILFLLWAILIAYSRLAFGVHYPLDILGGMTVSGLSVWLWLKYEPLKKWFRKVKSK